MCDFEERPNDFEKLEQEKDKDKGKQKGNAPVSRVAGEEWLFEGPHTYYPRVEVAVIEVVRAVILNQDQALHLRAYRDFVDREGVARKAGEEWLVRKPGAYLPDVNEKLINTVTGYVLTDNKALHLRARFSFTDVYGQPLRLAQLAGLANLSLSGMATRGRPEKNGWLHVRRQRFTFQMSTRRW